MTCKEVFEFLDDYIDNTLPDEIADVFENHVHNCAECLDFIAKCKTARRVAHRSLEQNSDKESSCGCEMPKSLVEKIKAMISQAKSSS